MRRQRVGSPVAGPDDGGGLARKLEDVLGDEILIMARTSAEPDATSTSTVSDRRAMSTVPNGLDRRAPRSVRITVACSSRWSSSAASTGPASSMVTTACVLNIVISRFTPA